MTGGDSLESVFATVRQQVDPSADERHRLQETAAELTRRAEAAIDGLGIDADVVQVGSTARGTWVSGDRDIDIFVRFETDLPRHELERSGLRIGNQVLPDGREEYADHPYVTGVYDGFEVDLVPCYRVESAGDIKSAVDRTPFHNEYLEHRLTDDLAGDVRLFKQFLKGIGAYGSDLKTRGFSGYLSELLVIEYGGFESVLGAAANWHPPIRLDPEEHGTTTFDDPLVVIDPTDPERNVAAVVAPENVARLQHYARSVLETPRESIFFATDPDPLTADAIRALVDERDTTPLAIIFESPDIVADQLYPQLRRSLEGLITGLEQHGFDVLRGTVFADESAVLFVELAVAQLPVIERHEGPPVHVADHAAGFLEKYQDEDVYGPFIERDRYVVERPRSVRSARSFVDEHLFDIALGARVESALASGYTVLENEDIASLSPEFGVALARYFNPTP